MMTNFINLADLASEQLMSLLERAVADKTLLRAGKLPATLGGKTLAMIFEKPSLRTRVSFETAMTQLGGHAICLANTDIGIGTREPIRDIARVLGRMCDGIMARTFSHDMVEELGRYAGVPVINALTDKSHPCQVMADVLTVREHFGDLAGRTIAFIGDGNNVARSLAVACSKLDMKLILACPEGYGLDADFVAGLGRAFSMTHNPTEAAADADALYTDTWVSMGQEQDKQIGDFEGFQINADLLAAAPRRAIVLHCLPAYRGYEITDEAFEAHVETILAESANRLHFQRTLLSVLMGEGGI